MADLLSLRSDFDGDTLRRQAKRCCDGRQAMRLLALAAAYDGMSRQDAARVGGMDWQTLRDWVLCFNGERPDGLADRHRSGRRRRSTDVLNLRAPWRTSSVNGSDAKPDGSDNCVMVASGMWHIHLSPEN